MRVRDVMTQATITETASDTLRAGIFAALTPSDVTVEHEFDQLVRQRRLARIEHGDLD